MTARWKTAAPVDVIISDARRISGISSRIGRILETKDSPPKTPKIRRDLRKVKFKVKNVLRSVEKSASEFSGVLKTASMPGQDLRLPITGGTKFPTDDSKSFAEKNLQESQGKAEVGPAPLMAKLKPKGPSVQDIAPKPSTSTAGSLPKIGHAMYNDPLIQYLRKQAMKVEDNHDAVPTQKSETPEDPGDGQDPTMSPEQERLGVNPHEEYLRSLFDNTGGMRQKYKQKEHPATSGQVDRILKR